MVSQQVSAKRAIGLAILAVVSSYLAIYLLLFDARALLFVGIGILLAGIFMRLSLGISLTWPKERGKMMYKNEMSYN